MSQAERSEKKGLRSLLIKAFLFAAIYGANAPNRWNAEGGPAVAPGGRNRGMKEKKEDFDSFCIEAPTKI